eukprot:CAMPEP_0119299696 /NCGR_PEP_ID=MMETSP1333-20130426/1737_1 /TAXON_ID=418940 /ORGANISM="Scyphosphaera apsteinii, Strain RCC1455" /LENGTH=66 /DNA_ID=CAMNT_0007301205 /DNA_START=260 /DNA_END=460 /DNA_ORIENTATION=+
MPSMCFNLEQAAFQAPEDTRVMDKSEEIRHRVKCHWPPMEYWTLPRQPFVDCLMLDWAGQCITLLA